MEKKAQTIPGEQVTLVEGAAAPVAGHAGIESQLPGGASTVSAIANASGGVGGGNIMEADIDDQLYRFSADDTPLMNLMLKAKKVAVDSPVVEHYMIDEPKSKVETTSAYQGVLAYQAILPLGSADAELPRPYTTLLVKGVNGYKADGSTVTPGKDLMLFVTGRDAATGCPIVKALNGPKRSAADEYCVVPSIPEGTSIIILGNAMSETQKYVDPDTIVPAGTKVYLQKRGMNQIVSDYLNSQAKRLKFNDAVLAEQALRSFKVRSNRTLWASRASRIKVDSGKTGMEYVYTTEGVRYQIKRQLDHEGAWSVEDIIGLAKMYFTGEDVPSEGLLLSGKGLLEALQCADFSKHPEIKICAGDFVLGEISWKVTKVTTVFGTINIKHEATLDRLEWSNSGALIDPTRLVHYVRTAEHSFKDDIEGHEAKRSGVIQWDALALKGGCHLWINGEGETEEAASGVHFMLWSKATAPSGDDLADGKVYYLTVDCAGIDATAKAGQLWQASVSGANTTWSKYTGELEY